MFKIIGGLLVAFGVVDFLGSFLGFDLWRGVIGVPLPDLVWKFTVAIEVAAGIFIFRQGNSLAAPEEPSDAAVEESNAGVQPSESGTTRANEKVGIVFRVLAFLLFLLFALVLWAEFTDPEPVAEPFMFILWIGFAALLGWVALTGRVWKALRRKTKLGIDSFGDFPSSDD